MKIVMHINFHNYISFNNPRNPSSGKVILSWLPFLKGFNPIIASLGGGGLSIEKNIYFYSFTENKLQNKVFNKILGLKIFTYGSLVQIVEREKPELIHIHNRHELVDKFVTKLSYRPKIVYQFHTYPQMFIPPRNVDHYICVSHELKRHVLKQAKVNLPISVLHNPYDIVLENYGQVPTLTQRNRPPKFIFGGGNKTWKGYDELAKAIEWLNRDGLEFELILAGPGTDLPDAYSAYKNVVKLGYVDSNIFYQSVKDSDFAIFPSHYEAFGLIVIEAMFLGKPVVLSRSGALSELADDSCAFFVEPRSPESLYTGIKLAITLWSEQNPYTNMARAAKKCAEAFNPKNCANNLEEIYLRII